HYCIPSPRASGERIRERGVLLSPTLSSTSVWRRGSNESCKKPICAQAEGGLEKGLANLRSRRRITKKAHAVGGQEVKRGISTQVFSRSQPLEAGKPRGTKRRPPLDSTAPAWILIGNARRNRKVNSRS